MKEENKKEETKREDASPVSSPAVGNPYENAIEQPVKKKTKKQRVAACLTAVFIALGSFLAGAFVNYLTLDNQMRTLLKLKNRIQKSYYEEVSDDEFYDVLFDAVSDNLLDEYSWYLSGDEYKQSQQQAEGKQSGLGLVFSTGQAGIEQMRVVRVCGNSPAEAANIVAGEYIVGFGASETELAEGLYFDDFSAFLEDYDAGERFVLKVRSLTGETRVISLAKSDYVENYVFYRTNTTAYRFIGEDALTPTAKGEPLDCLDDRTAYIRLTQFNGAAAAEFDGAMQLFAEQGKKNLVLDLRGNGGGYLDIMLKVARYFCKSATGNKPIVAVADYGEKSESFAANGNYYSRYFDENSRITVLADNQTASASECLIGCMLDYGAIAYTDICLAERGGVAKTYGKGIMQTTYPLAGFNGDAVKLTTARICWPVSKKCIHGVGVLPTDGALTVSENPNAEAELIAAIALLY